MVNTAIPIVVLGICGGLGAIASASEIDETPSASFYSWVVDPYVHWLYYGPPLGIERISTGFNIFNGLLSPSAAPFFASSGDHLGLDANGGGLVNQSAMVLEQDKSMDHRKQSQQRGRGQDA
jgi:hypothetical protein